MADRPKSRDERGTTSAAAARTKPRLSGSSLRERAGRKAASRYAGQLATSMPPSDPQAARARRREVRLADRLDAEPTYAQAARTLLRDTLLTAAADLLTEYGWADISMAAIASRAGVSRQTLYNEFGSREEFAQLFALREADRFLGGVEDAITRHPDDPRQAMRAAFEHFLTAAAQNPMVRAIVVRDPGSDELFALFTTRGGPVVQLATERVTRAVRRQWPLADEQQARIAAECLVRLAISHAGLPTGSIESAAQSVATLIGPFVLEAMQRG